MFLKHNIFALVWALFILFLCGIPGKDLPNLDFWEHLSFDKILHLFIFFILALLTIQGFEKQNKFILLKNRAKIIAISFAIFYGGLTEILQGTIFADRTASLFDFFANTIGAFLGMIFYKKIYTNVSTFLSNIRDSFDEILFENRFKEYGAYKLRKNYKKHMTLAILLSVSIFLTVFLIILMNGFVKENKNNIDEDVVISEFMASPPTDPPPINTPPVPPPSSTQLGNLIEKLKYASPVIVKDTIDYVDSVKNNNVNSLVENDSLSGTSNSNTTLSGNGSDVYVVVDELPKFPGGEEARIKFLQTNVKYPKVASYNGIKGVVYINFIIEKDGSMSNIKLLMGIGGGCDEEALRVARLMPKWTPGKRKGLAVRVYITMPIKFFASKS